jgi:hypothetical protein
MMQVPILVVYVILQFYGPNGQSINLARKI